MTAWASNSTVAAVMATSLLAVVTAPAEDFSEEERAWWAAQPVRDPSPPGDGHPIDAFLDARLAEAGLKAAPAAEPGELVRRIHFDLAGLPPSPEQVRQFAQAHRENADAAVAALVEELLASPRYGERWAGHWLDVVRYAESDGYREDRFRPEAHRYRDYVVRAFNEDKPYDRFVLEQLAADELAPGDPAAAEATGFLRLGVYEWNQRDAETQHRIMMDEMTAITGEVFLGLGIGCAKCHDHKFDPILQRDYYALQAFLSSTIWPRDRRRGAAGQLADRARWEESAAALRAEMADLLAEHHAGARDKHVATFPPNVQAMYRKPHAQRTVYERQIALLVQWQVDREEAKVDPGKVLEGAALERYRELESQLAELEKSGPGLPVAFMATDAGPRAVPTHIDWDSGKAAVAPGFPALLGQQTPEIRPTGQTTGRRSALARWIASTDNPFAARVQVNRIWQYHFGTGLVPTPNDFGTLGEPPSHPELLDWLASRFVEGGWRSKPLHRLIMSSAAYRRTARADPREAELAADPADRLLWRFPPARLSAEQIRDAMLAVSGELRHRPAGGPSVDGGQPLRSIYVKRIRNSPDEVLQGFDAPAGFDSTPTRIPTTTPTQSLLLVNNDWPLARARAFAQRVLGADRNVTGDHLARAFRMAWGREADAQELDLARAHVAARREEWSRVKPAAPPDRFPDETGLRPIAQRFSGAGDIGAGVHALWLQPGSRFERLELPPISEGEAFEIEAVAQLESIHKDASVNTLISRWSGASSAAGWSLGVTSAKSGYQPRNLIVQLVGENPGGDLEYEVVASGLRVPLGKPVIISAAISGGERGGRVVFGLREPGSEAASGQTVEVEHNIARGFRDAERRVLIGGRDQPANSHLWDGQLARLGIRGADGAEVFDARFTRDDGAEPLPGTRWRRAPAPPGATRDPLLDAMTDFCHVLLCSNEFLYLH